MGGFERASVGLHAADDARAAAERDDRDAVVRADCECGGDLVVIGGIDDRVGWGEAGAGSQAQEVGVGAPGGVGDAREAVVADVLVPADRRRELRAGGSWEAGLGEVHAVEGDGRHAGAADAELVAQQGGRATRQRGVVAVDAHPHQRICGASGSVMCDRTPRTVGGARQAAMCWRVALAWPPANCIAEGVSWWRCGREGRVRRSCRVPREAL